MGWCFYSHLVLRCTNRHPIKPFFSCLCLWGGAFSRILYLMYKQAPKQTYFNLFMFTGWCFYSHLALWCTNGHQNKPIFSCLYLWGGAFTRILYFDVQTGTESKLFLVVYVYEVVLFLASCTLVYKHAPKQAYFSCLCLWGGAFSRILHFGVQTGTKTKFFFSCLCLRGGAFTRILHFGVQTGTKTKLFLVVYV